MWNRLNTFIPKSVAAIFALAVLMPSCSMLPKGVGKWDRPDSIPVEDPGYFDICAGYGTIVDGHGGDVGGYMFSVKAYPFGRWYSNAISVSETAKKEITEALNEKRNGYSDDYAVNSAQEAVNTWENSSTWAAEAVVLEDAGIEKRFSVFYGHSLSDFDGDGSSGSYKCIGIGFDIAPEFALQLGFGALDPAGGGDLDYRGFVGLALNMNAFRSLVSGAGM